jgi:hypothetical protein
MKTGSQAFTLGEQILDTIQCHGFEWAHAYYIKAGVADWEFDILLAGQANLAIKRAVQPAYNY